MCCVLWEHLGLLDTFIPWDHKLKLMCCTYSDIIFWMPVQLWEIEYAFFEEDCGTVYGISECKIYCVLNF